jgi:hypothetical protein
MAKGGRTKFAIHFIILLAAFSTAYPFSYSSFPPVTPKGALAVSPYIFADAKDHGAMEAFLFYGLTEKSDLAVSELVGYGNVADFSIMPRYKIGPIITAVRANEYWADPQASWYKENERFYLQLTGTAHITYDYSDNPSLYGIVAPGVYMLKYFDLCCDIIPGYYGKDGDMNNLRTKGFALDLVPCLGFKIGEALFALSAPVYNVNRDPHVTVGLGIYYTIGGK